MPFHWHFDWRTVFAHICTHLLGFDLTICHPYHWYCPTPVWAKFDITTTEERTVSDYMHELPAISVCFSFSIHRKSVWIFGAFHPFVQLCYPFISTISQFKDKKALNVLNGSHKGKNFLLTACGLSENHLRYNTTGRNIKTSIFRASVGDSWSELGTSDRLMAKTVSREKHTWII